MSRYFDKFPTVTQTINNKSVTLIDISYAPSVLSETFTKENATVNGEDEIGGLSLSLYNDANAFWALLYANDQINPWEFIPERPSDYQDRNYSYSSSNLKFGSGKLNPNLYVEFAAQDIIVSAINSYGPGITAASSLFDFNILDTWFVAKAFSDTKKAKITQNLNTGITGSVDIADPNATVSGGLFQVLRKGATGYYLLDAPASATAKSATNLKSYKYLDSPAFITSKDTNNLISAIEPIGDSDSILTIIGDDDPGSTASSVFASSYNIQTTKSVQQQNFLITNQIEYIPQANFSKILNKLI